VQCAENRAVSPGRLGCANSGGSCESLGKTGGRCDEPAAGGLSSPNPDRSAVTAFSGARVAKALASSTLGQVLSVTQNFLFVPLFIGAWGEAGYGEWMSLTALTSYLALLDLGGQVYIGNRLAQAFAHGQDEDFRTTLRDGFSLYASISAAVIVGAIAMLFIPGVPLSPSGRLVVFWQAGAVALSICGGVLVTCYTATGRVVRATLVGVLFRILSIMVSVAALRAQFAMPLYSFVTFVLGVIATAAIVIDLRRTVGELFRLQYAFSAVRRSVRLLRGSLEYWVFSLAGALNLQGIVLAIASAAGNAAVAQFVTHRAASSLVTYAGGLLRPALWTEMTFMSATKDLARLRTVVSAAVRVSAFCAAVAGAGICVVAPFGYALWTRSKLDLDIVLLATLVAQAVLAAAWSAASWPLMSANRTGIVARWSVLNGCITVAGAFVCLRAGMGLRAVAFVSICADVVCALVPVPIAAAGFLGISAWTYAFDLLRALACAVPFAVAAYLSVAYLSDDLARLATFTAACFLLIAPASLVLLGRRELVAIVRRLLRKQH
jgi:O-antigen/teichoic acid export membrane protein